MKTTKYVAIIAISLLVLANFIFILFNAKTKTPVVETEPTVSTTVVTPTPQIVEVLYIPDMEIVEFERVEPTTAAEAWELIELTQTRIDKVQEIINNFAYFGYSDDRILTWSQIMISNCIDDLEYYEGIYEILVEEEGWVRKMEEYPTATAIWLFLKEQGYNDYVAAGILGNIMTEAGGQSLAINVSASNGSYYGICQWGTNFPGRYTDLDGQLNLLMSTIEDEFRYYGTMSYENFCALENERDAALVFARSYERCTSASYTQRQNNATTAYNYFTNN